MSKFKPLPVIWLSLLKAVSQGKGWSEKSIAQRVGLHSGNFFEGHTGKAKHSLRPEAEGVSKSAGIAVSHVLLALGRCAATIAVLT